MAILSVTVPDAAVPRIRNAVAAVTRTPAPASLAQVQDLCRTYLRSLCLQVEQGQRSAAVPTDSETAVATEFPA